MSKTPPSLPPGGVGRRPACQRQSASFAELTIQPEAVDPEDVEMLQDLVISAVNEAMRQAEDAMESSMQSLTGGLNIPGFGL